MTVLQAENLATKYRLLYRKGLVFRPKAWQRSLAQPKGELARRKAG